MRMHRKLLFAHELEWGWIGQDAGFQCLTATTPNNFADTRTPKETVHWVDHDLPTREKQQRVPGGFTRRGRLMPDEPFVSLIAQFDFKYFRSGGVSYGTDR